MYNIGDIVRTKKPHPCGSKEWEVTRIGVDFKLWKNSNSPKRKGFKSNN